MRLLDDRYSVGLFLRDIQPSCMWRCTRLSHCYARRLSRTGIITRAQHSHPWINRPRFYNRNSVLRVSFAITPVVKRLPGHCTSVIDQNFVIPLFRLLCPREALYTLAIRSSKSKRRYVVEETRALFDAGDARGDFNTPSNASSDRIVFTHR